MRTAQDTKTIYLDKDTPESSAIILFRKPDEAIVSHLYPLWKEEENLLTPPHNLMDAFLDMTLRAVQAEEDENFHSTHESFTADLSTMLLVGEYNKTAILECLLSSEIRAARELGAVLRRYIVPTTKAMSEDPFQENYFLSSERN